MSGSNPDPAESLEAVAARPTGLLTAEWRHVVILSYPADPILLTPFLPGIVEVDLWNGQAFVSLVGLLFEPTRVLGVRLPFHRRFEQINLRFYVRRRVGYDWRRGVVFVKEIVPYRSLVIAARLLYRQNYEFAHMRHRFESIGAESKDQQFDAERNNLEIRAVDHFSGEQGPATFVEYCWRRSGRWNTLGLRTAGSFEVPSAGSLQEFVSERRWGYAATRARRVLEFEVRRPVWVASDGAGWLDCDSARIYGAPFGDILRSEPASALMAAGSSVGLSPLAGIPLH